MAELCIDTQVVAGLPAVYLQGGLDASAAPRVLELLHALTLADPPAILVYLAGLDYIDSTGLGALVAGLKQTTDRAGTLALIGPTPVVARVLRITGLDNMFPVFADQTQALAHLGIAAG